MTVKIIKTLQTPVGPIAFFPAVVMASSTTAEKRPATREPMGTGLIAAECPVSHLAAVSPDIHSKIFGAADKTPLAGLPHAYALVILINLIGASFTIISLSFRVGAARKELNVDLPTMYATGKDAKSVKFNCIQRGHQQALETFTSFVLTSLVGGVSYPISVALFGLVYMKARIAWADGYATGDPKSRYSSKWAVFIWTTQMGCFLAAGGVALQVAGVM